MNNWIDIDLKADDVSLSAQTHKITGMHIDSVPTNRNRYAAYANLAQR